jgi:DNA primase
VDPDKGLFYCFGCGAGGDAIRLHMLLTGDDFPAAMEGLAHRYGIPLPSRPTPAGGRSKGGPPGAEGPDVQEALEAAAAFFVEQLGKQELPRRYLEEREIPPELVEEFGLGYAPDGWTFLKDALSPRIPPRALVAAGLVARSEKTGNLYDRFRHRLIFPIRNATGRLVGFGGRTLGDDRAKYLNTAETDQFQKSFLLYGLHETRRALREGTPALLVEGYFDVIGARACGLEGAVASMGTSLTAEQVRLLARYADEVVVGYDGDRAGETAAQRALPLLLQGGLAVRRAHFGEGHDPDSLRLEEGSEAVRRAVADARDAVLLAFDQLIPSDISKDPHRQAEAASAVSELLRPIRDDIVRQNYGRRAAQRLGVPEELLWQRARRQGARPSPSPEARGEATAAANARRTRNVEEALLARLLLEAGRAPALEDLPSEEIFFDPHCRRLFRDYLALYAETDTPPRAGALLDHLNAGGEELGQLARILSDADSTASGFEVGIREQIAQLERRWLERRRNQLAASIREAQQAGDVERLRRLVEERQQITERQYRGV